MRRPLPSLLVAVALLSPGSALAQRRLTFAFDAGLPENPTLTQQKLDALTAAIPSWVTVPSSFETLQSAPDGVTPPTVTLWLAPEVKAQLLRAGAAGPGVMTWPAPVRCAATAAFQLPSVLLASGAAPGCGQHETSVRQQLSPTTLTACLELEEPERYVHASRASASLSGTALVAFVEQHTNTLEEQIALVGAGLALQPVPDGLLPADWVPTMRRVLWKLRPAPTARVATARTALTSALGTLTSQAACFDATTGPALRTQVQALLAELDAMEASVSQVVAEGTAAATQQQQCLAARGRTRPALPYPALTDEEREFVAFYLGGVFWRMRGAGMFPTLGTNNLRNFFARRPFREIGRLANGTPVAEKAADAIYCNLFDGWGSWFDMGTGRDPTSPAEDRQDAYYDLVMMTDRGRQHVGDLPTGPYLSCLLYAPGIDKAPERYLREANYDPLPLFAGGLSMGPCYLYGLNPLKAFTYYTTPLAPAPYSGMFEGFTTIGEFCTGASLGLGLTRSLLNGTPTGQAPATLCGLRQCGVDACGTSCGTCASGMRCDAAGMCVSGGTMVDAGSPDAGAADAGPADALDAGGATPGSDAGLDAGSTTGGATDAGSGSPGADAGAPGLPDAGGTGGGGGSAEGDPTGCGCASTEGLGLAWIALLLRRRAARTAR